MSQPINPRGVLFLGLAAFTLSPWSSPAQALMLGMAIGLLVGHPYAKKSKKISGLLLRFCVVLLGFSMNLQVVLEYGIRGLALAVVTIGATFALGALLKNLLRVPPRTSLLITAGTAICGGSAIAAVGSVTEAEESEMTVAMATVFLLNAIALYLFPPLGHLLKLSQESFGVWAGIAIHDVSSVVGAASVYGQEALQTATAVKLSRALWIAPMTLIIARIYRKKGGGGAGFPWFILFFVLASAVRTLFPGMAPLVPTISGISKAGLALTLFLIGSGLSVPMLRVVGWRTLAEGVLLWIFISSTTLLILLTGALPS
ncbi:putative sulfate exporter family transporter [bacterium]|nr:putative sulfate exporter family transporter [bacterium]